VAHDLPMDISFDSHGIVWPEVTCYCHIKNEVLLGTSDYPYYKTEYNKVNSRGFLPMRVHEARLNMLRVYRKLLCIHCWMSRWDSSFKLAHFVLSFLGAFRSFTDPMLI